jgi:ribosome-associated translation inhibitor RaiA
MLVHLTTDNHIQGREKLVQEVESAVEAALARFQPQLTRVEVHLRDENGHKPGDNDKQCTLEARLAGLPPLAATGNGANLDQALDGALEKLVAQLDHKLGRLGDRKGRTSYGGSGGLSGTQAPSSAVTSIAFLANSTTGDPRL